jgi:hypothetical protein
MTPKETFVVVGKSGIYPGRHCLGRYGGFLPIDGGHGRLSEERCREIIRRFDTRAEAQAWSDENNALEKRVWHTSVEQDSI